MKKYGYVQLTPDGVGILCSWNETVLDRVIEDVTNTLTCKTVRDLVTDTIIAPDPFVYADEDKTNVRESRRVTYINGPFEISSTDAFDALKKLRDNQEGLQEYLNSITSKKALNSIKRKIERI